MDLRELHFAHPFWFWTLLIIPLIWVLFFLYYRKQQPHYQLEKFIDKHLIPFLLVKDEEKKKKVWTQLLIWTIVWSFLVLALAGPRWNYTETATFTRDQSLAILLDLSESMNATDILPSRLVRAKRKIEDLLNMSKGVKIGLIAFAADPHMIVPMTEDKETIRHLLSSLDTDLVHVQGSKLAPALEMSLAMLENEPGTNKAIVIVSDGGFEDASAIQTVKRIAEKGIIVHTIGVGTLEGAPLKNRQGIAVKKNGSVIVSKLEKEKFSEISKIGHGRYFDADYSEQVADIFNDLKKRSDVQKETHKTQRFWEEHFYLFILPVIPFFLWWYRRGLIFTSLLFLLTPNHSQASLSNYFYNSEQQANQAYEKGEYAIASHDFQDPYRKGVAYFRQGNYKAAEEMFQQSTHPEVAASAAYNLANTLVQQNKLQDAIKAYEDVLQKWPDHKLAKENLEIVKKMLEEQEQKEQEDNQNQENSDTQKDKQDQQDEQKSEPSQKQDEEESAKEDSQNDSTPEEKNDGRNQESPGSEEPSQKTDSDDKSPQKEKEESLKNEQALSDHTEKEQPKQRSQQDLDADLWLDQIKNDPKSFLKNKFYLESKKNGIKEDVDPW